MICDLFVNLVICLVDYEFDLVVVFSIDVDVSFENCLWVEFMEWVVGCECDLFFIGDLLFIVVLEGCIYC